MTEKVYDWIVVGAGITGTILSYELVQQGFTVLLVDPALESSGASPTVQFAQNATRYSYGGIAYWSGTTPLMRQLCAEGLEIHRSLSQELGSETGFRELDLLLTIAAQSDVETIASTYQQFSTPPRSLSVQEACQLEPLLNPHSIAGALTLSHGHVDPVLLVQSYQQAFERSGGQFLGSPILGFISPKLSVIAGVITSLGNFSGANVAIGMGSLTRQFLQQAGIQVTQYFTYAEARRFQLESQFTHPDLERYWHCSGEYALGESWDELSPVALDPGAIQFLDGRIRIGQISRILPGLPIRLTPDQPNPTQSEAELRNYIRVILPALADLPGTWQRCGVAFSRDQLPLVGEIPGIEGLSLFSGFSSPFAIVPPIARRFAKQATGQLDPMLHALKPSRFPTISKG
jgi:glycine/D-amino acid oxidase-like deaminating enzyme